MKQLMTVAEALKYARHDFINELQLIHMNTVLGREDEVIAVIQKNADEAKQLSRLHQLGMPELEEWLLTVKWRFPEIRFVLTCGAQKGPSELDGELCRFLEHMFTEIRSRMDEEDELSCRFDFKSAESSFLLQLSIEEDWTQMALPELPAAVSLKKEYVHGSTELTIAVQMEG